ncbi:MAG: hypothetical protein WKF30_14030 [Pyrinomonadaceae bacterium]
MSNHGVFCEISNSMMSTQAVNGSINTATQDDVAPTTAPRTSQGSSAINALHSLTPAQISAAFQHVAAQVQHQQSETDLAIALPRGRETLTRRELAYKIAEKVFAHNGVFVSRAALEEIAAELRQMQQMDINGSKRGKWVDPQLISQANGQAVKGYWFRLTPEFQQHILGGYKNKALQVTESGTQPVTGANMQERMRRAIGLAYERHLTPELRTALGENATPERIAALVGVAGTHGRHSRENTATRRAGDSWRRTGSTPGHSDLHQVGRLFKGVRRGEKSVGTGCSRTRIQQIDGSTWR